MGRSALSVAFLVAVVTAPAALPACSTFGTEADPPNSGDAATTADGAPTNDGGVEQDDASNTEAGAADAGITPFGPTCSNGDPKEKEDNDAPLRANPITSAICGELSTAADVDWFKFAITSTATVRIGYALSGNGKLAYDLPGKTGETGASSSSMFRAITLEPTTVGVLALRVSGGVQTYRISVSQQ